jgi:tRNA(His) guanylyltransferase
MNANEFERRMRKGEVFHPLRMPPGVWSVLRVDGRGFSRLTEGRYEKPFDLKFHGHMVAAARAIMEEMQGVYAYTESDEISLLLPREWQMYDREVEKAVSLCASTASAAFTHAAGHIGTFDGRIWLAADASDVVDYFRWRQSDASRCCLNGWCYWTLRNDGYSAAEATEELDRKNVAAKNEILFQRGINFNDLPVWQRRGVGVLHSEEQKHAVDQRLGASVVVSRRVVHVDRHLPIGDEYSDYIRNVIGI